jgi:hypothetical protein
MILKRCEMSRKNEMYMITLYDKACSSLADGTVEFFTDDIEDFERRWFALESDENLKGRYLQSKSGEIVADWYSDQEELNIYQKDTATIYDEQEIRLNKVTYDPEFCPIDAKSIYAENLSASFRWIGFKGKFYRIAKFKADGVCELDTLGRGCNETVYCHGNNVLESHTPLVTEYRWIFADMRAQGKLDEVTDFNDASKYLDPAYTTVEDAKIENFKDNTLQSICFLTTGYFENEYELLKDAENFEVTEEVLGRLFADVNEA